MVKQQGLTLIELIITIVVISVAVVGVVGAFSLIVGRSADPLWQTRSIELGQAYLDEILARPYDEHTPTGGVPAYDGACAIGSEGESRDAFDDVDDYDSIEDEAPQLTGTAYNAYRVSVEVVCAGDEVGLPDASAKRISVTITPPGESGITFSAYKGNY